MSGCSNSSLILRSPQRGFTIVELLVSAAITMLLAGLIVGLISNALINWNRTQGILTTENQARQVFDRLAQDLQGSLYRDDGSVWLAATVQSATSVSADWVNGAKPIAASLNPAAANLADARFGVAAVWLRFFTTAQGAAARTGDPAAPVAVAYQVIRRTPTPSAQSCQYLLYRSEVTPSGTFAAGYDLSVASYTTGSTDEGAAGNVARPGIRQVMADNVIDFGVRFYAYAPDAAVGGVVLQQIFPLDAADLEYQAQSAPTAGGLRHRFPAVADVQLRVLTDEGARQIAALEASQIPGEWWAIATANSRVFTRRVMVAAGPP